MENRDDGERRTAHGEPVRCAWFVGLDQSDWNIPAAVNAPPWPVIRKGRVCRNRRGHVAQVIVQMAG